MRQIMKYRFFTIPGKIRGEISVSFDNKSVHNSMTNDGSGVTTITPYPFITLTIIRPYDVDEEGRSNRNWNPNDQLMMTKATLPLFIDELEGIRKDLLIPELYKYIDKKLEVDEELAAKIRRVAKISTKTVIELSAVVITQESDTQPRVEGIKMKFNNEQSSVYLTLNDLNSLSYALRHLQVDSIVLQLYSMYKSQPNKSTYQSPDEGTVVDILPKEV